MTQAQNIKEMIDQKFEVDEEIIQSITSDVEVTFRI